MEFHAHVYFDPDRGDGSRESVSRLRDWFLRQDWPGLRIGSIEDALRGPHPKPMFELEFGPAAFERVVSGLLFHRGEHPVLVHAVTGNDPVDHDRHAFWLGEPLALDRSRLDPPQPGWRPPSIS